MGKSFFARSENNDERILQQKFPMGNCPDKNCPDKGSDMAPEGYSSQFSLIGRWVKINMEKNSFKDYRHCKQRGIQIRYLVWPGDFEKHGLFGPDNN
ncbi:MAG: hypothetical protein OEZ32_05420 [Nitrospinota bacterium]|nr:hypothetical protein [Nitrospinota bacterium]